MAVWVMRRPLFVLIPALAVLVIAGTPFLQLRLASGGVDQLPPDNTARQGYDTLIGPRADADEHVGVLSGA